MITKPNPALQEQKLKEYFVHSANLLNEMTFAGRTRQAKELKYLLDALNMTFKRAVNRSALHREL